MMIDFHAHILPEMDHGCRNLEMYLKQMEFAYAAGMDLIVATPHFYPQNENVETFLKRRSMSYEKARQVIVKRPEILLGAEVLICKGMEHMDGLEKLCIENTNVLLLEMPLDGVWENELLDTIEEIQTKRKLQVVIAHPDRYPYAPLQSLFQMQLLMQMNGSAIKSMHGRKILKECRNQQSIAAIGSDIHGIDTGYRHYLQLCKKLGTETEQIMERTCQLLGKMK